MRKYCKYCGKLYNPDSTFFHGDNHVLLTTPRYDEDTGQELDAPGEYCEYCGAHYDPGWNIFHGDQHILLTIKRYDKKTGRQIE